MNFLSNEEPFFYCVDGFSEFVFDYKLCCLIESEIFLLLVVVLWGTFVKDFMPFLENELAQSRRSRLY